MLTKAIGYFHCYDFVFIIVYLQSLYSEIYSCFHRYIIYLFIGRMENKILFRKLVFRNKIYVFVFEKEKLKKIAFICYDYE